MPAVMTSMQLQDRMTPAIHAMERAVGNLIGTLGGVRRASDDAISTSQISQARTELVRVEQEYNGIQEEVNRLRQAQEDYNNSITETVENAGGLKDVLGKIAGAAATGIVIKTADDYQSSLNSYQSQTGVSDAQMDTVGASMKNLYTANMGEDFNDLANSMALVTQVTGTTGMALEEATSNALLMRDTFEYDVAESLRAVDQLQKQFGLTSAQAYDQIAQATQAGLNKSDDLLDTISEYSVQFKKIGLDSSAMFNMLSNGAASGVFSMDFLSDATKEFAIRMIDGSATTSEGFKAIGMDADKMASRFGQGGETAKTAFTETMTALGNMKDPIAQNTAGVNLFGTKWEDLGAAGVLALSKVDGSINVTTANLEKIQQVKYDSAGAALAALGRTINMGLADAVGGAVKQAAVYIQDFTAGLQGDIENANGIVGTLGYGLYTIGEFITSNWPTIEPIIWGAVTAFTAFKTITFLLENRTKMLAIAQNILNLTLLKNPIFWIAILIGILIAAIVSWVRHVGGLKIAWLICVDKILTAWDQLKLNVMLLGINVMDTWDNMGIGIETAKTAILDTLGSLKVAGLTIVQDFINGVIDDINKLIDLANKIPGVSIETINHVSFAADAGIEEEAKQQSRAVELAKYKEDKKTEQTSRRQELGKASKEAEENASKRQAELEKAREDVKDKGTKGKGNKGDKGSQDPPKNQPPVVTTSPEVSSIAGDTKSIKNSVTATKEDLKYLRNIAEREVINRFTTASIKVDMTNHNSVNGDLDLDGISSKLRSKIEEEMYSAAEGVH